LIEGLLFNFVPRPFLILLCKVMEGTGNIGESLDELVVKVAEADEFSDTSDVVGFFPGMN
jgi:hypothetical protein